MKFALYDDGFSAVGRLQTDAYRARVVMGLSTPTTPVRRERRFERAAEAPDDAKSKIRGPESELRVVGACRKRPGSGGSARASSEADGSTIRGVKRARRSSGGGA